ncbi:response regulator [Hydrogenophaga sp. D2P1]|uniref:Sensory/regulatory protein RpfC n=1 Tax=Hydrogenophaga aromaticivorans TaxID=2610898 RepID=A0A7Y8H1V4_9BURK|nr:response regulator [Hydrogenophaga aromaticivorans]NWF48324.1 response regulator [Hydrogenophaga aromaticivorans]
MPFLHPASVELARIQTLRSLATLDTSSDPTIQSLLKVAALTLRCTRAAVCLMDGDQHWIKASYGLDSVPESCGAAFAAQVAACDDVLVLTDTGSDPLSGEPAPATPRLFVGAPVRVDGHSIGVLCLFGAEPRTLSDIERTMLLELRTTVEHWLVGLRERLQLEARTREFRELAEQMPGIVYRAVMDEASSTLYVSSRVRELGYTPEEWMARPEAWMQALHPEDSARVLAELADGLKNRPSFELQYRIRNAAGDWRHYHDAIRIVRPSRDDVDPVIQGLMTDVTDRVRDTNQPREEAGWLSKLAMAAEQATASIVITDIAANIEYVNQAMVATSGYSRDELMGQNSRILQSGLTPGSRYRKLWAALGAGKPWRGFFNNRRKDGSHYIEFAVITPVRDPDGRVTHYLAVKEDITDKRRMSEDLTRYRYHLEELVTQRTVELEKARRSAEAANAAKSAFLATMSHEIRTPMNGVMGVADVLLQTPLSPAQQEMVETINESAAALLAIIDDILDFSKIEAGRLVLEEAPFAIRSVVGRSCAPLSTVAAGRGVRLHAFADPRLPDLMLGDGNRVRQILLNLVGNAIKFSAGLNRPGRVTVRATPVGDSVRLEVADNGIGMTDEVQRLVFQPFIQGEASTTRNYGGTGLGLAISHRLVSAMGGSISVRSQPDAGATFTVDLPLKPASAVNSAISSELVGIHALLVLDDADIRDDWAAYLSAAGARVSLVDSTDDAAAWPEQEGEARVVIAPAGHQVLHRSTAEASGRSEGQVVMHQKPRTEPVSQAPGQANMSVIGLRRKDLLVAVAMAAGRVLVPAHGVVSPERERHPADWGLVAACQGRAILVAEDNEINQRVLRYQLELLGLDPVFTGDGQEALALWRQRPDHFCLLLTDLQMPGLSGIELTEAIRKEEAVGHRMPIIALTANAMHSEVHRCRAVGMDDYLTKPVSLPKLETMLHRWLEVVRLPAPAGSLAQRPEPQPEPVAAGWDGFDDHALQRVLGADPEILQDMRSRYLASLDRAQTEIREAAAREDSASAGFTAHRIKSSSRLVGAVGLAQLLDQIETLGTVGDAAGIARLVPSLVDSIASVRQHLRRLESAVQAAPLTHVLCIDDDPVHLNELVTLLAQAGAPRVERFTEGSELQQRLAELDTSQVLLLLDLHMPCMNGVELIQHLRQWRFNGHVALIGHFDHQMLDTAERLVDGYGLKWAGTLTSPLSEHKVRTILQACGGLRD